MSSRRISTLACLACLVLGATVSVLLGQDTGWDLRNYHLANAFGALHGRVNIDLDPAGLQSYFNPVLDFVYEGFGTGLLARHPRLLAAIMGLPYGVLIFATIAILRSVLPLRPGWPRGLAVASATVAATTGAGMLCQVGTAFNEVTIGAFVVVAVAIILPALDAGGCALRRGAIAGAVLGFGTGLKMTALIFAPPFALALLLTGPGRLFGLRRVGQVVLFCITWIAGFTASAGWWAWVLWQKFGNPFFPLFNAVFRSPWYPPVSFFDVNFLPRTTLQWLFYPFWWATWRERALNSELAYRDPRLAAGFVAAIALIVVAAFARERFSRRLVFVLLLSVGSYLLWLRTSAIMRYGVTLEVLSVVLVAVLLAMLIRPPVLAVGATILAAACCVAWTIVPDYGRVAYGPKVFDVDMGWTPPGTLFVAITGPTAYATVFAPKGAGARTAGFSFINLISEGWPLTTRTAEMVRDNAGPIYVLVPRDDHSMVPHLGLIGLSPDLGACRDIHSNLDGNSTQACLAHRLP